MDIEKIIEKYLSISQKDSRILAIGIGGSGSTSEKDEFSDIDFFVIVKRDSILSYLTELPQIVQKFGDVCIETTLGKKDGFGNRRYWVIFSNLLRVEFNLDTPMTLEPHPFIKFTEILYDKDGFYTKFISENLKNNFDKKTILSRITKEFFFTCDKIYVNLSRDHFWASIYYVERLRHLLYQLLRINKNILIWPQRPFKRFEKDFPNKICKELKNSLVEYDKLSIWNAFNYLVQNFKSETVRFSDRNGLKYVITEKEAIVLQKWIDRSQPHECKIKPKR